MGGDPLLRLALWVVLLGLSTASGAAAGVILRRKAWRALLPLFVVLLLGMTLLDAWFPVPPHAVQLMNAAETRHLHRRLTFDAIAIILSVGLGNAGLMYAFGSEGRSYLRAQTEKASLESEMAAAREVQRVTVPEELPPIIGYGIESVYRPAADVGGDFFQVIPLKSGRTLVVIGDVSGKGLRAAMIVSMIVGMLGTLSGFTEEPAEILAELNRRLYGRTHGGFATCLVVRVEDRGRLALASAGHPPPYLNGREVPVAGSMPLGLIEIVSYEQTSLEMQVGDIAVLLTDGIAEAQNQERVLLGFPRIESLLREGATAKNLVETAQQHGQNDDLTVLSIAREA
jgi:serine phosphatase RsbU (regulator of sigma subunit)